MNKRGVRRCAGLLGLGALLAPAWALASHQAASVTAFVDVAVVPMDRERVLPHQTVVVAGSQITALGPVAAVPVPAGAQQVDGKDKFLLPGLAEMHGHLGAGGGVKGVVLNPAMPVRAMLLHFLAHGVTTVRDMRSGPPSSGTAWMPSLRQQIASGELLGPRIYAAGDPDRTGKLGGLAKSVEALHAAGYDYVKLYEDERPQYDSIVETARRVGLPVVGHVPPKVGVAAVLADRWASIEHLMQYAEWAKAIAKEHEETLDPAYRAALALTKRSERAAADSLIPAATIRQMAEATREAGVWNCPTLTRTEKLASIFGRAFVFWQRMTKALQDAGAGLLLGSDAAFMGNNGRPEFRWYPFGGEGVHLELEQLVAAGLTPYQALAAGTRNVARFLGTEDSTGTVAVGKRADLILLDADPLADIRHSTALAGVMRGGRWLPKTALDSLLAAAESP